jgi:hypothetical protein
VYDTAGGSDAAVVTLAAGWEALDGAVVPRRGYRWRTGDRSQPIRAIRVLADRIQVKGGGSALAYTLDEPSQGRIAVRLTFGTSDPWCAEAPARATGSPPSTVRADHPGKFIAQRNAPAPATCPPVR